MRLFLAILLLSYKTIGFAQTNLIENGSFEELIACPPWAGGPSSIEFAKGWSNPVWYNSSPDLWHSCANDIPFNVGSVPRNGAGFQYPLLGSGYAGFFIFYRSAEMKNRRELIQSTLSSSLDVAKQYKLSFSVSFGEGYSFKADKICAVLTEYKIEAVNEQNILSGIYFPGLNEDDVILFNNLLDADTSNWTYFSKEFTAKSAANYLTIGNIFPDSLTVTQYAWPAGNTHASYIYIDDISLICLDCDSTASDNQIEELQFSVSPNPANDFLQIKFPDKAINPFLEIFSLTGQRHFQSRLSSSSESVAINFLPSGVYLVKLTAEDGHISTRRLVVAR